MKTLFSLCTALLVLSPNATVAKQAEDDTIEIHLLREYLDGEKSIEVITETIDSMSDFWLTYHDWQLIEQSDDVIKLHKKIQDISPLLKTNGYFGLSENGILTIFDGKPADENAIQSFYQIDIDKLESKVIDRLKIGIPIKTKNDFVTVISKLRQYEK